MDNTEKLNLLRNIKREVLAKDNTKTIGSKTTYGDLVLVHGVGFYYGK